MFGLTNQVYCFHNDWTIMEAMRPLLKPSMARETCADRWGQEQRLAFETSRTKIAEIIKGGIVSCTPGITPIEKIKANDGTVPRSQEPSSEKLGTTKDKMIAIEEGTKLLKEMTSGVTKFNSPEGKTTKQGDDTGPREETPGPREETPGPREEPPRPRELPRGLPGAAELPHNLIEVTARLDALALFD